MNQEGCPILIRNSFLQPSCEQSCQVTAVGPEGEARQEEVSVACEHLLSVYINEKPAMELVCSPELLVELVLGRLLTEGIISGPQDVETLYICEQGARCRVFLRPSAASLVPAAETVPSCCTGNRLFLRPAEQTLSTREPYRWRPEWITALAQVFAGGTPVHNSTHGTHSCILAKEGVPLYCCEDLGRHNALDKAVGCALRNGVDLGKTILYTSGRVPVDMMQKVIRAGVPVIVSNAVPTDQAVSLAKQYGVTLICRARPRSFLVFSGADRMDKS